MSLICEAGHELSGDISAEALISLSMSVPIEEIAVTSLVFPHPKASRTYAVRGL